MCHETLTNREKKLKLQRRNCVDCKRTFTTTKEKDENFAADFNCCRCQRKFAEIASEEIVPIVNELLSIYRTVKQIKLCRL